MASLSLSPNLLKQIRGVVGRDNVLTEPGELLAFESDALTAHRATPAAVAFVNGTDQIQQVVSTLRDAEVPFVPRGAGTGLSGGALADGAVIIELSRMNRICWIDAENRRARVQPGVINTQLAAAVASCGLMYAPDPSSQTACTLGGNVAENSGGPHCLKYGVTTNHIVGLTVVTPDGEVIELPGPGKPGYDLVGLFVGSEGTLGVCSEIEVNLVPLPASAETLLAHFDDIGEASRAVSSIIAAGILPAALEMIDQATLRAVEASVYSAGFPTDVAASLIVELDGPRAGLREQAAEVEALLEAKGAREVARATSEAERLKFWKARKSAFGAMGRIGSDLLVQDATVPRSRIPEVLARVYEVARKHGLTITNVFHAGDGNLHPNIPYDHREPGIIDRVRAASEEIMEACVAVGGTITGEHGVGVDKRHYMRLIFSEDDLQSMRWVKEVFDPSGLCNPGKVFPKNGDHAPPPGDGPKTSKSEVAATVESVLGTGCLIVEPEALRLEEKTVEVAVAPRSVEELSELIQLAHANGWSVVPVGQGSWLVAGRPLDRVDLVLTTRRLNAQIDHHPDDLLATVSAGVLLSDLNARLGDSGQWWPLDPLGNGTVGATIATAATGPLAGTFGAPRDSVLGLTLVRGDGRVVKAGGKVVKNVAGYDMTKLYTGSWGTLGVIAEAHLRLHALPKADVTRAYGAGRPEGLVGLAFELGRTGELAPAAAEVVSPVVAGALGIQTGQWILAVRWLGHGRAVEEAVRVASKRAAAQGLSTEARGGFWSALQAIEGNLEPAVTVRADAALRATGDLIRQATPFSSGSTPAIIASPLQGRIWLFVSAGLYEEVSDERAWALRIDDLRGSAKDCGGTLRVERAPVELRRVVDPWGDLGSARRYVSGLKRRFDPHAILKPGFISADL